SALSAYQSDPWPLPRLQGLTLDLAWEVAEHDPAAARRFYTTLNAGPLPGYLVEMARRELLVRLSAGLWQPGTAEPANGYALFEPWPVWTRESLRGRYAFYKATGLGDAARARQDLATFLAAEAAPFQRGLEPRPVTAQAR
ncbi:MAG: hypothetical protein WCF18_17795, partial [Chthoniobacteraceae bacterium]